MAQPLIGELRKWQQTAGKVDRAFNPQPDPADVAAREAAIAAERRRKGKASFARAQSRKQQFLKEEAERRYARMTPSERAAVQRQSVESQLRMAIPIMARMMGFGGLVPPNQ
jgi:hypothetical protein